MRRASAFRVVSALAFAAIGMVRAGIGSIKGVAKTKEDETARKIALPSNRRGLWGRSLPMTAPTGMSRNRGQIAAMGIGRLRHRIP